MAEDLRQLKRKIDNLGKELARDEGSLAQLMEQLHELGYDSLEDAAEGLKQLEREASDTETQLSKQIKTLSEIMEAWDT